MQRTVIAPKPGIKVILETQEGALKRVTLSPCSCFCVEGPCEPKILAWLRAYAKGKYAPFPFPLSEETFQGKVLRFLQTIPMGKVLSYREVAQGVDCPRGARAIGNICRGNLFPLFIPCHRVIRSDGTLGHYTPDPFIKRQLLEFEQATLA